MRLNTCFFVGIGVGVLAAKAFPQLFSFMQSNNPGTPTPELPAGGEAEPDSPVMPGGSAPEQSQGTINGFAHRKL
jgi:hypothetical protein